MSAEENHVRDGNAARQGVIPAHRVRLVAEPVPVPALPGKAGPEPEVRVIQEGGVVLAVDIVCCCGQRIRLRCCY